REQQAPSCQRSAPVESVGGRRPDQSARRRSPHPQCPPPEGRTPPSVPSARCVQAAITRAALIRDGGRRSVGIDPTAPPAAMGPPPDDNNVGADFPDSRLTHGRHRPIVI